MGNPATVRSPETLPDVTDRILYFLRPLDSKRKATLAEKGCVSGKNLPHTFSLYFLTDVGTFDGGAEVNVNGAGEIVSVEKSQPSGQTYTPFALLPGDDNQAAIIDGTYGNTIGTLDTSRLTGLIALPHFEGQSRQEVIFYKKD